MAKPRRLSDSTPHTVDDQLRWYLEQKGPEALERNMKEAAKLNGKCICHPSKMKMDGGIRVIHTDACPKWKPWMAEAIKIREERRRFE